MIEYADLSLTLSANPSRPPVGSDVTFTVTVENEGPTDATGVSGRLSLPETLDVSPGPGFDEVTRTWTVGSVPAGGSRSVQVVANVTKAAEMSALAEILTADQRDPDSTPGNDAPGEDDRVGILLSTPGIHVNTSETTVSASDNSCTLIEAIVAANTDTASGPGARECVAGSGTDTIYLQPAVTYTFTTPYLTAADPGPTALPAITSEIVLEGLGSTIQRTAPVEQPFRLLYVPAPGNLTIRDVTVRGGLAATGLRYGAGIFVRGTDARLTVERSQLLANVAHSEGGAISNGAFVSGGSPPGGTVRIVASTIQSNSGSGSGGGVSNRAGSVEVTDTSFRLNSGGSGSGGGLANRGGTITVSGGSFTQNSAQFGGGIWSDSHATLTDVNVEGNTGSSGSGGIDNGGILRLVTSTVVANTTGGHGGGIGNLRQNALGSAAMLSVENSVIAGNTAGWAGGGIVSWGPATLADTTLQDNTAGTTGGGIVATRTGSETPSVSIIGGAVRGNIANGPWNVDGGGGGIAVMPGTTLAAFEVEISANRAANGDGGGAFNRGTLDLTGGVVRVNSALSGAGVSNGSGELSGGTLSVQGTLVEENSATASGGGLATFSGSLSVDDATVAWNSAAGDGGGIFGVGQLSTARTTVTRNRSTHGGGISTLARATLSETTFSRNHATAAGGGLFVRGGAGLSEPVTITGGAITDNTSAGHWSASGGGGGLANGDIASTGRPLTVNDVTFSGNHADFGDGGGIFNRGELTVNDSRLLDNAALSGGGLGNGTGSLPGGTATLNRTIVEANVAMEFGGGGLSSRGGELIVNASTVKNNRSEFMGGGIATAVAQDGSVPVLTVNGSGIGGNVAQHGAGIRNGGIATVSSNSLIGNGTLNGISLEGNRAIGKRTTTLTIEGQGGGIENIGEATLSVTASTVAGNKADLGGGIFNTGTTTIAGSTIGTREADATGDGNRAAASGGGIRNVGTLTVTDGAAVSGNVAGNDGGGIAMSGASTVTTIDGAGVSGNRALAGDGGGVSNGFQHPDGSVTAGGKLTVEGGAVLRGNAATASPTLTGIRGGGGIAAFGGVTDVVGATVEGNAVDAHGGGFVFTGGGGILAAAWVSAPTELNVRGGSAIRRNEVNGPSPSGGGILVGNEATLALTGSRIEENHAGSGGGVQAFGPSTFTRAVIRANKAPWSGGGLQVFGAVVVVDDTDVLDNRSRWGGGIHNWAGYTTIQNGTLVSGNEAAPTGVGGDHGGGGIVNEELEGFPTLVEIRNSTIAGNHADSSGTFFGPKGAGGGILNLSSLDIASSVIRDNTATSAGGIQSSAPDGTDASVLIRRSTLTGNEASVFGAIHNGSNSTLTLDLSTVYGNRAEASAAGLGNNGVATVTASTISGNTLTSSAGRGAGIANERTLVVQSSTITGNVAPASGGGFHNAAGSLQLRGSIVAGNSAGTAHDCSNIPGATLQDTGFNVLGRSTGCPQTVPTDRLLDAQESIADVVAPLADNGGETLTHALVPGSLALDAGPPGSTCVTASDQRDLPRVKDGDGDGVERCDSGSFEQQTFVPPAPRLTSVEPARVSAGGPAFTLDVRGARFVSGSEVRWDGAARPTTFVDSTRLAAAIPATDLVSAEPIRTARVTVVNPDGQVSTVRAVAIAGPQVLKVASTTTNAGGSSTAALVPKSWGQPGVSGTLTNSGGGPATVTAAVYGANPTSGTIFSDGGFVDLQVTGVDAGDSLVARFYYPTTITGTQERALQLRYWTGTRWRVVVGAGGAAALKDAENNLDGSVSGGRFTVTLDDTSIPKLTELSGTVLTSAPDEVAPETNAALSPAANAAGWHAGNVTVTLAASDEGTGVTSTEFQLDGSGWQAYSTPVVVGGEGTHTLAYRSTDGAENVESQRSLTFRIDKTAPLATVGALAPETTEPFTVSWSGVDALSGVLSYDVLVSVDGGPFTVWKAATTDTSAVFAGEAGHTYGFAATATDRAGNHEALPAAPEATIRVAAPPQPPAPQPPAPQPPAPQPPAPQPPAPSRSAEAEAEAEAEGRAGDDLPPGQDDQSGEAEGEGAPQARRQARRLQEAEAEGEAVRISRRAALALTAAGALGFAWPAGAATITVGGGCGIVDAIKAANTNTAQGGCPAGASNFNVRDTVVLQAGATYTFTSPYAPEVGPAPEATALPHLASVITIEGNGATLERSTSPGTPRFRLLRASAGNVIVNGLTLRGGDQTTGGGVGGGMYASSASVTLNDVTIEDNRADLGGGLAGSAELTLNRAIVRRNAASLLRGGGLLLTGTSVVRDSAVADNTAEQYGGGISSDLVSSQSLTVLRTTVSGNEAGYGGGLHTAGPAAIANSTISGNRTTVGIHAEFGGAGIFATNTQAGVVQLTNTTVAANEAGLAGQAGGIFANVANVRLANSIVIGNNSGGSVTAAASDCKTSSFGGSIASEGNNVFGLGTGCGLTGSDRGADGSMAFSAVLRPLTVNPPGGMLTHGLRRLSPALDGGNDAICAADPIGGIDQRGVSRSENARCDIGAFEAQRADLELTAPSVVGRPPLGSNVTLTLSLRNVGPSPATSVTVHTPIPEGLVVVSAGAGYDSATGLWAVGSLAKNATASLTIVARVDRFAVYRAEVFSFDQEDPDSVPGNGVAGEDDQIGLAITPPGIWVNTTVEAATDDGRCNIVEAVFAAQSDTAPFATPGECTAGDGADTIHLQPAAKYVSTDVWFSGDAFPSINSTITIEGNGATIERGITPKYFRALQVHGGGVLTLRNLGMHYFETRDETCGGAINLSFGSLVLDNVLLSQNRVRNSYMGGGAICNMYGRLTASNSRIEDNTVDVSESFFATRGGGITTNGEPAVTTLTATSIRNNTATSGSYASGGGLELVNGGTLHAQRWFRPGEPHRLDGVEFAGIRRRHQRRGRGGS